MTNTIYLAAFSYTVKHRPGKDNIQSDLSMSQQPEPFELDPEIQAVQKQNIEGCLRDVDQVRKATRPDPVLSKVVKY